MNAILRELSRTSAEEHGNLNYFRVPLGDLYEFFSALTVSIVSSVRFVLALLLVWTLVEIVLNVKTVLAVFVLVTLPALAITSVVRWRKPAQFGAVAASNGSLNLLPLAIPEAALLFSAVRIADRFQTSFDTPLLLFFQNLFHKIAG